MRAIISLVEKGDIKILYLFNKKIRCTWLNVFMGAVTQLGSTGFSVLLPLVLIMTAKPGIKNLGAEIGSTLIIGQIMVQWLKRVVNRPRPYKILEDIAAKKPPACKYSFPSGHTCAAFSIAFQISANVPGLAAVLISIASMVAISRIYLGFHYPSDVAVGVAIAYVSYII
ncbi:MAG TPA: phosphatase PAP2 family protein [Clostridiales bacterium]|nr:phosphatase PAP2 family protein [Clostridiales bacterium]